MEQWRDQRRCTLPHVFGDLKLQVSGPINETSSFLLRQVQISRAPLVDKQYCFTHGADCLSTVPVDFDVSGLPCQDNSKANINRQFFQHGKHGSVYLAWAKRHSYLRTPLLILENTPDSWMTSSGTEGS